MIKNKKTKKQRFKRVLVFGMCGIGDLMMAIPLLRSLSKSCSHLTLVVRKNGSKSIFDGVDFIDEVIEYPKSFIIDTWTSIFKSKDRSTEIKKLVREIRFLKSLKKQRFDVSLWALPGEGKRGAIIGKIVGARQSLGLSYELFGKKTSFLFDKTIDFSPRRHRVNNNLDYVRLLGIVAKRNFILKKTKRQKNIIGIHPGTDKTGKIRRWPAKNFYELIKMLLTLNMQVRIFFGPDDKDVRRRLQRVLKLSKKISFVEEKLTDTIKKIAECKVFLTTDSGLGHIANAYGIAVVAIFGPANPFQTAPYGKNNIVVQADVNCRPCRYIRPGMSCPYKRICLTKITPNMVFVALKKILDNKKTT